jgi:hypothetical protein
LKQTTELYADQTGALSTVVLFCLCFSLLLWSAAYRGLYADGSNLLLHVIQLQYFYHVSQTRVVSTFITQLPVVLAIRFGLRSTAWLATLYTASLAIVPISCYALSIWITRREPVLFCATVIVIVCCLYPLSFLLVGEGNVYLGLFWLSFIILTSEATRGNSGCDVLLLLLSIAALEVYETSTLFSAVLALMTGWRAQASRSPFATFVLSAAAILFIFGAFCGASGIIFPRDRGNESGFSAGIRNLPHNTIYLRLLAIMFVSVATAFLQQRAVRLVLAAVLFVGIFMFANQQLHTSGHLALGYVMFQRAQVYCTLFAVVAAVLTMLLFARDWPKRFYPGMLVPPLIAVLSIDTVDTLRWTGFIGRMCEELSAASGASHAGFFAEPPTRSYGINWTFPTMSVLAGNRNSHLILVEPGFTGWQPFDPRHAPNIQEFKAAQTICR